VWPHMTVFDNVAFPLTDGKRRLPRSKVRERVMGALEMVQLSALAVQYVLNGLTRYYDSLIGRSPER
jgi:ABC-type sulfate/molybdate transport systems ATPase subunit